jgi:Flp pilus assembly protein TadD
MLHNYARAEEALLRATRLDPNDKASWNNLGIVLRAAGAFKRAYRAFTRALNLDPDYERAKTNLAMLQEDAISLGIALEKAGPRGEAPADPRLSEVYALRDAGDTGAAIDACEALCTSHSEEVSFAIELFKLYRELGDTQTGLDALEAFRVRYPDDIDCVAALGHALIQQGEFKLAKPLIEQALEARPEDVPLLIAMSDIRSEQDRHSDAGELIEKAHALDPSIDVKGKLAASLVRRCKYEETLSLLDEIVTACPAAKNDLLSIRDYALTYQGRYEEAMPDINAAI